MRSNISRIIVDLVGYPEEEHGYGYPPEAINEGLCDDFAGDVVMNVSGAHVMHRSRGTGPTFHSHTFVKYRGKYYDSERPEGVSDWSQLPFFKRNKV